MSDDMELYRKFEALLLTVIEEFERKHNCEINLRLIEVKPIKEE